jgi:two-component system OmpR family response regulator
VRLEREWPLGSLALLAREGLGRRVRVLIVEGDVVITKLLRNGLRGHGMLADVATRGEDALWMAGSTRYDAIVLDLRLPGIDGLETCRRLRADSVRSPILMLAADEGVEQRVAALDSGADDYVTKPFFLPELLARLRALARRGSIEHEPVLTVGDLRLDPARRRASRGGIELRLSAKEFTLLEAFMRQPGVVLSRERLLESGWDFAADNRSNVVASYVRLLRRRIDRPFGVRSIETVRGAGYRLREDAGCEPAQRSVSRQG